MNRKILALLLGVSMTLAAVTGCSSGKKETEAETKKQTEVQTEAKTEAKTEAQEAAAEEAATEAEAAVEEAVSEAEAAAESVAEEAAEMASEADEAVEEAVSEAEAAAESVAGEAAEMASEADAAVEEAVSEAEEAAESVAEEAAETMTEADAVAEEAASEAEAAVEAAEEVMSEAEAAVEDVAEEVMSEAEAVVEEAVSEAEAAVEDAAEEVMSEAGAAALGVAQAAAEMMTEAEEAVEEAATEAEESVEEAATEAEETVEEAVTEAEAVVEEAASEAEEAVESVAEDVVAEEAVTEAETEEVTEAAVEDIDYTVAVSDVSTVSGSLDDFEISASDIVILFNNDVHGGISADKDYSGSSASLGYAGMAAVKADAVDDAAAVITVDLGDAIQGSVATTETDGKAVMDLMAAVGYDIRVPGNHEFDYGMDAFLAYAEEAGTFISSNFIDNRTGEPVFNGHTIVCSEVNGKQINIGFVGITTPETIAKSTPTYFQDEEGNYIYGFDAATPQDMYDDVQMSVDACYADGADLVIAVGHLGDTGVEPGWSSIDVAANTTGISAFLDGHSHSVLPCELITNKDGEDVILSSTGTKLEHIGTMKLTIGDDNNVAITCGLVDELTEEETASDAYADVDKMVQEIQGELAYLFVESGTTDFDLVIYDPVTGDRMIRNSETNLGDFLSDIYLNYFDADVAVLNGGSIRANIEKGDIVFMDILTVYPWNTNTGVVEVSGQVILDMLEMGAHLYPEECGGWILPAGMTYDINATIPSSVNINSDGEFVSVDGEYRVQNVMIGDEPLDLEKTYRLAINEYYSQDYGDGMTMFKGCKVVVPAEGEEKIVDHDVVVEYLESIGGKVPEEYKDPYGQGRINIITEIEEETEAAEAVTENAAEEAAEAVTEDAAEEATEAMTE